MSRIISLAISGLVFCSSAAGQFIKEQAFEIRILKSEGLQLEGAKIDWMCENKTRTNVVWSSEVVNRIECSCTFNSSGVCQTSVPLTRYEYWGKGTFDFDISRFVINAAGSARQLDSKFSFSSRLQADKLEPIRLHLSATSEKVVLLSDEQVRRDEALRSRTALISSLEYNDKLISLKDDELESNATFSTASKIQDSRHSPQGYFIRVFVNKKTLIPVYQIYAVTTYHDSRFRSYNLAKYLSASGPESSELIRAGQDVNCADKRDGLCRYQEQLIFEISARHFAEIADSYRIGEVQRWRFRLSSQAGVDEDGWLPHAEFAAVHRRVNNYIKIKGASRN
jgi:hypothetical protein